MSIRYESKTPISVEAFGDLLHRSGLAERRPVDDPQCMEAMLRHADILATAWGGAHLVGVARALTDFEYCCYLSDLAVDRCYQGRGIGRGLLGLVQSKIGPRAKVVLLAAPNAESYYAHLGLSAHPSAWVLPRNLTLR